MIVTVTSRGEPRAARGDPASERAARRPARAVATPRRERLVRRGPRRRRDGASRSTRPRSGGTLAALRLLHRLAAGDDAETRALARRRRAARAAVAQPRRHRHRGRLVPPAARHAVRGHGAARALPPVRRPRQQPRLVHVHAAGDAPDGRAASTGAGTRRSCTTCTRWARAARACSCRRTLDPWEPNVDGALVAAANALGAHVAVAAHHRGPAAASSPARCSTPGRRAAPTRTRTAACASCPRPPRRGSRRQSRSRRASSRRADGARPAHALGALPAALAGRHAGRSPTSSRRSSRPRSPSSSTRRAQREHWLRTALAANRRACARREPYAFVIPAGRATDARRRAARRVRAAARRGRRSSGRRASFEAGGTALPGRARSWCACSSRRAPSPRRCSSGSATPTCARRGRAAAAALRRHRAHAAAAARRRGRHEPPARPFDGRRSRRTAARGSAPARPPRRRRRPALALAHTSGDLVAAARLLAAGVRVRWALEPFERRAAATFAPGTLLVPAARARQLVAALARELGLVVARRARGARARCASRGRASASTAPGCRRWTRAGRASCSRSELGLALPGAARPRAARAAGLRQRFDAIVLPDQSPPRSATATRTGTMPPEYTGGLGERRARPRCASSSSAAARSWRSTRRGALRDRGAAAAGAQRARRRGAVRVLLPRLDPARPRPTRRTRSAHGLPPPLPVWFEGSPAFEVGQGGDGRRCATRTPAPLLSGYLLGGERLAGRAALVEVPLGKGRVVLFGFRPQYRAQSRVTYPALLNALYLSAAEP